MWSFIQLITRMRHDELGIHLMQNYNSYVYAYDITYTYTTHINII